MALIMCIARNIHYAQIPNTHTDWDVCVMRHVQRWGTMQNFSNTLFIDSFSLYVLCCVHDFNLFCVFFLALAKGDLWGSHSE